jgi:catechol 2,3-dioxygenase-like lactoylglutathione lyase family enzyme
MAHLRHITLSVPDPETTAPFYEKMFGMTRVGTLDHDQTSGVYLSDGVVVDITETGWGGARKGPGSDGS